MVAGYDCSTWYSLATLINESDYFQMVQHHKGQQIIKGLMLEKLEL